MVQLDDPVACSKSREVVSLVMATLPSVSTEEEQVEMDLGTESVHVYRSPRISEDDEHLLDHMEGINNSLFRVSE